MIISVPKERRPFEFRVGLSPSGVELLVQNGHMVQVEHDAGVGAGFSDGEYEQVGAKIIHSSDEIFMQGELILKISRPMKDELSRIQPRAIILGMLHLASTHNNKITELLDKEITSIAYEQIQEGDGSLPVLRPFSQIGGSMAAGVAAQLLQNNHGGKGILLDGIPGVPPAEVAILGAGTVGTYAARAFEGLGAHVTVLDIDINALHRVNQWSDDIVTMPASLKNITHACLQADVLVGAVLIPGQRAPVLVSRDLVKKMKPRSVIVDLSIDEGGCVETSHATTHDNPTYIEENIVHYCVPNMPGVVARTATHGFVNAAIPYILDIANQGADAAIKKIPAIEVAVNTHQGKLFHLVRLK